LFFPVGLVKKLFPVGLVNFLDEKVGIEQENVGVLTKDNKLKNMKKYKKLES
jgi:hypothetical protein